MQLPPPIHGASIVNQRIFESTILKDNFETKFLNITLADDLKGIGKFRMQKLPSYLKVVIAVVVQYIKFKPDLTYITMSPIGFAFLKDAFVLLLVKALGGQIVIHLHGKGIRKRTQKSRTWRFVYKFVLRRVHIIHLSSGLFGDIETIRDSETKLLSVPNGIKIPDKKFFCNKNEVLTFIYLSNFIPSKGADILIKACSLIPSNLQSKFQVKLIGGTRDEQYSNYIDNLISVNKFENIEILGAVYGDEKYNALSSSSVFILPTRYPNECFPLSILEAMASKLAVISTNEGAIPEIVDNGHTGQIIEDLNPLSLADSMIKYIQNPELVRTHSSNGKAKFDENFTISNFENNLIFCIRQILKSN